MSNHETKDIAPALSAKEWASISGMADFERAMVFSTLLGTQEQPTPANFAYAMALANAALPDGDPRKITREDVAACRAFDFKFWDVPSSSVEVERSECEALQRLAAKLAAFLPPE